MTAEESVREDFEGYESMDDKQRLQRLAEYVDWIIEPINATYCFALILIAAFFEGTNPTRLASLLNYDLESVQKVAERMIASGLWLPDGSVSYESFRLDELDPWLCEFATEVGVAEGKFVRVGKNPQGRNLYGLVDSWSASVSHLPQ